MPLPTATETMKEAVARRGPRLPELGSVDPLPSFALKLAPKQVQQASAEYRAALEKLAEARAAVHEARQGVVDADWRDRDEARSAAKKERQPKAETAPA